MTTNRNSTRYYSSTQEKDVARLVGGQQTANSGAGNWVKGDVRLKSASVLLECKTCIREKESFSIKREWLEKNEQEAKMTHYRNSILAFNFGPSQPNYFIINENLMKYLVEKLKEDNAD